MKLLRYKGLGTKNILQLSVEDAEDLIERLSSQLSDGENSNNQFGKRLANGEWLQIEVQE